MEVELPPVVHPAGPLPSLPETPDAGAPTAIWSTTAPADLTVSMGAERYG
jgi:hypothetical protein